MANILLSFYDTTANGGGFLCYYDSIIRELLSQNNNVMAINIAAFSGDWLEREWRKRDLLYIRQKVEEFKPDLAIAFNHQIFPGFYNLDCETVIWDGDGYSYFACKNEFRKKIKDIKLITSYKKWISDYRSLGIDANNIFHIAPATAVKKENLEKDKNISFIGTNFCYRSILTDNPYYLYERYLDFLNSKSYDYRNFFNMSFSSESDLYGLFDIRSITLIHLLDLGLHLYGIGWNSFEHHIPQLAYAYDKTPFYTLADNSYIYNSSKIAISISHPQTKGQAFPWRIFDIMASSACLVSSYSEELKELTQEHCNLPMYRTPIEAHDICQKLLKDNVLRNEIVVASNEYVDKHARWTMRFKQIEEIFGIKLCNDAKFGKLTILEPESKNFYIGNWRVRIISTNKVRSNKDKKIRIKIWPNTYLELKKMVLD